MGLLKKILSLFKKEAVPQEIDEVPTPIIHKPHGYVTIDDLWREADALASLCGMTAEQAFKHFEQDTFPKGHHDFESALKLRWQILCYCNQATNGEHRN